MKLWPVISDHRKALISLISFWFLHIALVAPAVPPENILPASFGATALTAMSLSFVLVARWRVIEKLVFGRDRAYMIHRWLGYTTIIAMALHWILASPGKNQLIPEFSNFAADLAVFASISLVVLGGLSALKAMPYHLWIWTHRLLGPLYLLLIIHSFFSPIPVVTQSPSWYVLFIIAMAGVGAWLYSLRRLFTQDQPYEIVALNVSNNTLDLRLKPLATKHHWLPGQFANLTPQVAGFEEAHPFSFASAMNHSGEARFIIRALGDFSSALPNALTLGDTITVSKPVGQFRPRTQPSNNAQVWLASGIGITPFLAALDVFTDRSPQTTLIYCVKSEDSAIELNTLHAYDHDLPNFTLLVLNAEHEQLLTTSSFHTYLDEDYQNADLFICGAYSLKNIAVQGWKDFNKKGKIHHEHFDFRAAVEFNIP